MTVLYDNRTERELEKAVYDLIEKVISVTLTYENHSQDSEISISFVDNDEIKELNKEYRNIDKVTDVLSFPLGEVNPETKEVMLGDIVVSTAKAEEQAEEYGHAFERELGFLVVHSMLHLLGYDHMNDTEEEIMFKKQEEILTKVGLVR